MAQWQWAELHGSGTLRIHLSHALGLRSMDSNGFSDPYVKLSLGKHKAKSKVIKKTLNPRWDEEFHWRGVLQEFVSHPLNVACWDYDLVGRNDSLGETQVDLSGLQSARQLECKALLTDHQARPGEVYLTVTWDPDNAPSDPTPPQPALTHRTAPPPPHQTPPQPQPTHLTSRVPHPYAYDVASRAAPPVQPNAFHSPHAHHTHSSPPTGPYSNALRPHLQQPPDHGLHSPPRPACNVTVRSRDFTTPPPPSRDSFGHYRPCSLAAPRPTPKADFLSEGDPFFDVATNKAFSSRVCHGLKRACLYLLDAAFRAFITALLTIAILEPQLLVDGRKRIEEQASRILNDVLDGSMPSLLVIGLAGAVVLRLCWVNRQGIAECWDRCRCFQCFYRYDYDGGRLGREYGELGDVSSSSYTSSHRWQQQKQRF